MKKVAYANTSTGTIYVNKEFSKLTPIQKKFVLEHEKAHLAGLDEEGANDLALEQLFASSVTVKKKLSEIIYDIAKWLVV
ncbi:MAG: hypothetical protein PHU97_08420 [Bacteroidales bacterium]|nr:hypothetical protein [Bacteroidales bacterium]MDD3011326.1 hypothetical protein [Bacteroidales bacterium]MDY0286821.1 hypothetical protein [Bacteroidales bacterium]